MMKYLLRLRRWISKKFCSLGYHDWRGSDYSTFSGRDYFYKADTCRACFKFKFKTYPNKLLR